MIIRSITRKVNKSHHKISIKKLLLLIAIMLVLQTAIFMVPKEGNLPKRKEKLGKCYFLFEFVFLLNTKTVYCFIWLRIENEIDTLWLLSVEDHKGVNPL